jgi:hypothetical protein
MPNRKNRNNTKDFSDLPLFRFTAEVSAKPRILRAKVLKFEPSRRQIKVSESKKRVSYLDKYLQFAEELDW